MCSMPKWNIVHMLSSGSTRHQLAFSEGLLTGLVGCCMVACHLLNMLLAKRLPCCCKSDLRASQVGSPPFSCCGSLQAKGLTLSTRTAALQTPSAARPGRVPGAQCSEGSTTTSAHMTVMLQQAPGRLPPGRLPPGRWCTQPTDCLQQTLPVCCHGTAGSLTRAWPSGLRQLILDLQVGCSCPQLRRARCHQLQALLPCCAVSQVLMSKPHQQLPETLPAGAVHFNTIWSLSQQHVQQTADTSRPTCTTHLHRKSCSSQQGAHLVFCFVNKLKPHNVSRPILTLHLRPAQATYWLMHVKHILCITAQCVPMLQQSSSGPHPAT